MYDRCFANSIICLGFASKSVKKEERHFLNLNDTYILIHILKLNSMNYTYQLLK